METPPPGYGVDTECTCMDPVSAAANGHDPGCIYSTIQGVVPPRPQSNLPTCDCLTPAPLDQHLNTCPFAIWRNNSPDVEDHLLVVSIEQVNAALLATPIDTGESPDSEVIGTEAETNELPNLSQESVSPMVQGQTGIWNQINASVQPEAQVNNLEAVAIDVHKRLGLTDVVSLGFLVISLEGAVEFDKKMTSMR